MTAEENRVIWDFYWMMRTNAKYRWLCPNLWEWIRRRPEDDDVPIKEAY